MMISLSEDVEIELISVNEAAKLKNNEIEILKKLSEFIQFHSDAKQLSDNRVRVFSWQKFVNLTFVGSSEISWLRTNILFYFTSYGAL